MQTHETFIQQVAALATARLAPDEQAQANQIKLVYGTGPDGTRGVTYYGRWQNGEPEPVPMVEVCAGCEESWVQLAGTTIHELAHVLAGFGAGHGKGWKEACKRLGLRRAQAAGQSYFLAALEPDLRMAIAMLERPEDGQPRTIASIIGKPVNPKPCGAGIGTRGGRSRGKGSGSRLVKVTCGECGYTARVARSWLAAMGAPHCPAHGAMAEG